LSSENDQLSLSSSYCFSSFCLNWSSSSCLVLKNSTSLPKFYMSDWLKWSLSSYGSYGAANDEFGLVASAAATTSFSAIFGGKRDSLTFHSFKKCWFIFWIFVVPRDFPRKDKNSSNFSSFSLTILWRTMLSSFLLILDCWADTWFLSLCLYLTGIPSCLAVLNWAFNSSILCWALMKYRSSLSLFLPLLFSNGLASSLKFDSLGSSWHYLFYKASLSACFCFLLFFWQPPMLCFSSSSVVALILGSISYCISGNFDSKFYGASAFAPLPTQY